MKDVESGKCVACPKGTYSDMIDATSCTSCPEGTDTASKASGSLTDCTGKKVILLNNNNSWRFEINITTAKNK